MVKLLVGVASSLLTLAIFAGVAWAAVGGGGGEGATAGILGGASGLGGLGIVGYLLIRYLPKRDEDLMSTLATKDEIVIDLIKTKDEQVHRTLEQKDLMWSRLLEQNDKTWQENFASLRGDIQSMQKTNDKLRMAILHLSGAPGMTSLGMPAMKPAEGKD